MVKKDAKKQALGYTASALDEVDLKKVKKEGFLAESVEIIFLAPRSSLHHHRDSGLCF
jgi:hypothetical protein